MQIAKTLYQLTIIVTIIIPTSLTIPSQSRLFAANKNPSLQEHSNEPKMSVHVWLHPPLSVKHSLISGKNSFSFKKILARAFCDHYIQDNY